MIDSAHKLESIDLISFAIFDLMKIYNRLLENEESKVCLSIIFSSLLNGMSKISDDNKKLEQIHPALDLVDQILNIYNKIDDKATLIKQKKNKTFA